MKNPLEALYPWLEDLRYSVQDDAKFSREFTLRTIYRSLVRSHGDHVVN